ncbi:Cell wall-binding protein YocH precursor [Eubacteriaceae bacterium CHKCI004]|nr:Cell wall-binding protein YocH precursor [Eubacteriaceae bacterium CHKCI004]
MNCVKKRLGLLSVMTLMGLACLAPQRVSAAEIPYNPQETAQTQAPQNPTPQAAEAPAPTPTIKLNKTKKSLERDDKLKLRAKVRNSSTKKIIWKSSRKRVATVDKRGVVTAKDKGKTTITATIAGTDIKAECVVTVKNYVTMWVKTTGYCNCSSCAGQWAGAATASGTRPRENHTIAVDKRIIPLGTKVRIGDETYVAEDTGGAIKGNKIDVYYASHGKAMAHGVKYQKIRVYI